MGTDNFHKKRKARTVAKKRIERKAVLIALEDTKSSKYYFSALLKDKGFRGKVIIATHKGTNPKKVLEALRKHKEKNPNDKFEKEWIVIDKDDWTKEEFKGTIETTRQTNICVAFSNEAYELWILLHFEKVSAHTNRTDLNSKLNQYFEAKFGKSYSKSSQDVYKLIIGLQNEAIKNAENLIKMHIRDHGKLKPYEQNPLTMIHQLVTCLNTFYHDDKKCDCFPLA